MSAVRGVLDDLVSRRLWPVALLLVVLAAAAPVLLAKDAEPAPAAPSANAGAPKTQPIASLVDDFSADARRRVLGAAKDPFRPTGRQPKGRGGLLTRAGSMATPGSGSSGSGGSTPSAGGAASGGDSPSTGGGLAPSGSSPVTGPTFPTTPEPSPGAEGGEETYALHSLRVRLDGGEERTLERLAPLPDAENPAVIYLGLLKDAKTAVFLLDESVSTDGDGSCQPSPEDCQRLHLKKGETQFFTFTGTDGADGAGMAGEIELELVSITTKRTASASRARAAYAASSEAGRRALRSQTARVGRLRYDARTGLLRRLSALDYRIAVARAAAQR